MKLLTALLLAIIPLVALAEPRTEEALRPGEKMTFISFKVSHTPLKDAIAILVESAEVNVILEVPGEQLVSGQFENDSVEKVVNTLIAGTGLSAVVEGDLIRITAPENAKPLLNVFGGSEFSGALISLNLKSSPLPSTLKVFEKISKKSYRAELDQRVNLRLFNIPWDQAFSLILHLYGLKLSRVSENEYEVVRR